ncbi:hypothetical protein PQX77_000954 [Marasmius sp. AFHP31]|nr:hypothetical protein PQX77_000954 [Marasmius sp. AFHP31]
MITSKNVVSSDGGTIYAEAVGDSTKPAIVFIPGYALPSLVFQRQFEDVDLRKEFYLIRYDPRGHGQSVMPETEDGHSSQLYADDFAAVCKAFGASRPVVAAWSLAGAIIVDICTYLGPEAVSGVIYMAALPVLDAELFPKILSPKLLELIPEFQSTDDVALFKRGFVKFSQTLFHDPSSIPQETQYAWLGASLFQPPTVSALILTRAQDNSKLFEAGRSDRLKVLFVHGNQDAQRVSGMAVVEAMKDVFKEPDVAGIEGAGHSFFYEKPEKTNEIVAEFARKVSRN